MTDDLDWGNYEEERLLTPDPTGSPPVGPTTTTPSRSSTPTCRRVSRSHETTSRMPSS